MKAFGLSCIVGLLFVLACAKSNGTPGPVIDPVVQNPDQPVTVPVSSKGFQVPIFSAAQKQLVYDKYSYIDASVPRQVLQPALLYYAYNFPYITNPTVLTLVDFSKFSGEKRFWVIDMRNGTIFRTYVAHGIGSDPNRTGYAKRFSNTPNSYMSSLGFYLMEESIQGPHGLSLLLEGLSKTNSNARARAIYLHGAPYVLDQPVNQGRSEGCFAVPMDQHDRVVNLLKGGSLLYAWSNVSSG